MWQAPTDPAAREPAVRLYLVGEALLDTGDVAGGTRSLKAAFALAWELGTDHWPGWASAMYARLQAGLEMPPPTAPVLLVEGNNSSGDDGSCDGSWWCRAAAILGARLNVHNYVVVDNFAGTEDAMRLRAACSELSRLKAYESAKGRVREGGRSDSVAWEPPGFETLVSRTDALLSLLHETCAGVRTITARQRAMVSCYRTGDYFARHVDNACLDGVGPHCSPRILTMVYYMQGGTWNAREDGGCLRIFRPQCALADAAAAAADCGDADALVDIAPVGDRLVVFYSDFRCPHEVLPVRRAGAERYAATIWCMGPQPLPAFWTSETRRSQLSGDHDLIPLDLAKLNGHVHAGHCH
jgi:hypothetical protein